MEVCRVGGREASQLTVRTRLTRQVTLAMILKEQLHFARKTKIICTAGPACWGEDMFGKLLEAGLNVLRLNFSHGDQKGHQEVLDRFRSVSGGGSGGSTSTSTSTSTSSQTLNDFEA